MYIPANHNPDDLERQLGPAHMLYEWRDDITLASRWPTKADAKGKGYSHKALIALYHYAMIAGKPAVNDVRILPSDSWKSPGVSLRRSEWGSIVFGEKKPPIVVISVHTIYRYSQYQGWLTVDDLKKIAPVNINVYYREKGLAMRHVILPAQLKMGLPGHKQPTMPEAEPAAVQTTLNFGEDA